MARISRRCSPTSYYHVIIEGANDSNIFQSEDEKKYYSKLMNMNRSSFNISIIAYSIASNHVHVVLKANVLDDLSRFMQYVNSRYGEYFNRKNERVGHVFKDRFKPEGLSNQRQLLACINYLSRTHNEFIVTDTLMKNKYESLKEQLQIYDSENDSFEHRENTDEEIINNYFIKKKIDINSIKTDKALLKSVIIELKDNENISLRKIASLMGLNREIVRKLYRE